MMLQVPHFCPEAVTTKCGPHLGRGEESKRVELSKLTHIFGRSL